MGRTSRSLAYWPAVLLRLLAVATTIARRDVDLVHNEVELAGTTSDDDGHLPRDGQIAKLDAPHVGEAGLRVYRVAEGVVMTVRLASQSIAVRSIAGAMQTPDHETARHTRVPVRAS